MFTGLVQALGTVSAVEPAGDGCRLAVTEPEMAKQAVVGESISVNGACLTVVEKKARILLFEVGPETLTRTNLSQLQPGDRVNLERALRLGDPLGGHIVTGHIDAVGEIAERKEQGEWQTIWFRCPDSFDDLMVHKGSICVDGVSLTVNDVVRGKFSAMLIPHTLGHTTLGVKAIGDAVNLEADLLAKHVKKLFTNLSIKL